MAFTRQRIPPGYLAEAWQEESANGAELDALRATLAEQLSMPVLLDYGRRYMHSIGQLYKGGPDSGMFLMITYEEAEDLPIPGTKYTFGQLEMALALGDLQSLGSLGKPALRLHLTEGVRPGLAALRRAVTRRSPPLDRKPKARAL